MRGIHEEPDNRRSRGFPVPGRGELLRLAQDRGGPPTADGMGRGHRPGRLMGDHRTGPWRNW